MSYDPPPPRGGPSGPPPRPRPHPQAPPPGPEEVTRVAPSWDDPAPRSRPAPERGSRHYDDDHDDASAPGPRGYGDPEARSGHLDPESRSGHVVPETGGRRRRRDDDVVAPERSGGRRRRRDEDDEPAAGGYGEPSGYDERPGYGEQPGHVEPGGRRRAPEEPPGPPPGGYPPPGGRRRAPEPLPPRIPPGTPPGGLPRTPPGPGTPPGGFARTPPGTPPGGLPRTPPGTPPGGLPRTPPGPGTPPGGFARTPPGTPPGGMPRTPPGPGTPPGGMPVTGPGTPPGGALGRRLDGEPEPQTPGRRPHPGPPPADATRYTSAFSGSLPPSGTPARRPRPRPVDPPTEIIKPVDDDYDDEYDDYDDYEDDVPPPRTDSAARRTVRTVGELLITFGLVILLFVVYEVYITDLISAGKQDDATHALDDKWGANTVQADPQRQAQYDLVEGEAFAKMYIPAFGPDFKFSIVEGTSDKHLEIGPGHYVNTALPGAPGNFAVAGHRVGKGAPFNDLDLLGACDAIIVETRTEWFVYRMLPKASEVAGWAQSDKAKNPKCGKVSPLGAPYDKTVGQEIVLPTQGEVIDAVPHFEGEVPQAQQVALLTLTTCHPRFSDRQRLIVHAVLTQGYPKAEGFVPEEFKEQ
ncbi:class E sortase [Saccharothrix variisporea]|nr:class E sortase [Saccharothrix variisporea]